MILSRAPFRVSFCGGGSDLPSFYEKYGGCVVSVAINKYVYIALHPSFDKKDIVLRYSKTESVKKYSDIEHNIFRNVLEDSELNGIEITSMADVPAGTGMGSSSSFTVALLNAISIYKGKKLTKSQLAQKACFIEINKLGNKIGKQDQYASAYGGLNFITFNKDGTVRVEPIEIDNDVMKELESNLMLFYTGLTHDASAILSVQSKNLTKDNDKIKGTIKLCNLAKKLKENLNFGNIDYLGYALNESWKIKKKLANGISNIAIDNIYERAIKAGASGGKLLGAGGGGFMLFYVPKENRDSVKNELSDLIQLELGFDFDGAKIIYGM